MLRVWLTYLAQNVDRLLHQAIVLWCACVIVGAVWVLGGMVWRTAFRTRWRRWRIHRQLEQERRQIGAALAQARREMREKFPRLVARGREGWG